MYLEKHSCSFISRVILLSSQFRYGRKPVFFITMAIQTIFSIVLIFSPSWIAFTIIFCIAGMGQMANYVAAFVLGTHTFYNATISVELYCYYFQ